LSSGPALAERDEHQPPLPGRAGSFGSKIVLLVRRIGRISTRPEPSGADRLQHGIWGCGPPPEDEREIVVDDLGSRRASTAEWAYTGQPSRLENAERCSCPRSSSSTGGSRPRYSRLLVRALIVVEPRPSRCWPLRPAKRRPGRPPAARRQRPPGTPHGLPPPTFFHAPHRLCERSGGSESVDRGERRRPAPSSALAWPCRRTVRPQSTRSPRSGDAQGRKPKLTTSTASCSRPGPPPTAVRRRSPEPEARELKPRYAVLPVAADQARHRLAMKIPLYAGRSSGFGGTRAQPSGTPPRTASCSTAAAHQAARSAQRVTEETSVPRCSSAGACSADPQTWDEAPRPDFSPPVCRSSAQADPLRAIRTQTVRRRCRPADPISPLRREPRSEADRASASQCAASAGLGRNAPRPSEGEELACERRVFRQFAIVSGGDPTRQENPSAPAWRVGPPRAGRSHSEIRRNVLRVHEIVGGTAASYRAALEQCESPPPRLCRPDSC